MAIIVPAVVGAAAGIYSIASGIKKQSDAKKAAAANVRPNYTIPPEDWDNQRIAQSLASQGLTDTAKQTAMSGYDRGLTTSIDAILKGGGDVNSVDKVYDNYLTNVNKLSLADDETRLNNINRLMTANAKISSGRDTEFSVNQYAPYVDKAKAAALLASTGAAQLNNGISGLGQAVSGFASGEANAADIRNINSQKRGAKVDVPTLSSTVNGQLSVDPVSSDFSGTGANPFINNTVNSTPGRIFNSATGRYYDSIDFNNLSPDHYMTLLSLQNKL